MKTMSHLVQGPEYKSRHKTYGAPCMRSVIIPETRSPSSSAAPDRPRLSPNWHGGRCERSSERARSAMRVVCKYGQGNRESGWSRKRRPFLAIVGFGDDDDHARTREGGLICREHWQFQMTIRTISVLELKCPCPCMACMSTSVFGAEWW